MGQGVIVIKVLEFFDGGLLKVIGVDYLVQEDGCCFVWMGKGEVIVVLQLYMLLDLQCESNGDLMLLIMLWVEVVFWGDVWLLVGCGMGCLVCIVFGLMLVMLLVG